MPYHLRVPLLVVLYVFSLSVASTYYVATDGSDAGDGSEGSPFATLQKGADAASSGDVVLIRSGAYGKVYANNAGVTFKAVERHGVVLNGNGAGDALFDGAEDITLKGLVFTGRNGALMTGMVRARTGWTFEDCRIEGSQGESDGIVFTEPDYGGNPALNITIKRCIFQDNAGNGMWGNGEGAPGGCATCPNLENYLIEDCILRRNNRCGQNTGFYNGGTKLLFTDDLVIDGLISYDNYGVGLWIDFGHENYTIKNCTIFGNHAQSYAAGGSNPLVGGIFFEGNPGPAVIEGNTLYRNGTCAFTLYECKDMVIENNLFFDNGYAENGWVAYIRCYVTATNGRYPTHDITFRNNRYSGTFFKNCWGNEQYNIVDENNTAVSDFDGDLPHITYGGDPSPQLAGFVEDGTTIDDAIADASVGDAVTIPVFGRKTIVEEGGQWTTEVYDLDCRYMRLTMDEAGKTTVEETIPQYAIAKHRDLEVTLVKKEEYAVEATMGTSVAAMASRDFAKHTISVAGTGDRVEVTVPGTDRYAVSVFDSKGRRLIHEQSRGTRVHAFDASFLGAGSYVLTVTMQEGALSRPIILLR
ncbi:MAG: hypothetical protein GF418_14870 [Chitinivibrionales bacterium]|nr:hypothetical protein [Chitinivibrionales bacterium]MBD3396903.1 hypothetical protein [Chitinivibrionales bacterium]